MNKYFAASNSSLGFRCYYGDCFSGLDKLYIIKGGPGTGKSSLMKRVSRSAEEKGYSVEYFYCSSDQESLDGVILYKDGFKMGIIDGTSPHAYDMKYAGAVDNIVNLGEFWNNKMLEEKRDDIILLSRRKTHEYNLAYDYLCSCGNLSTVIWSQLSCCANMRKMIAVSKRLLSELDYGEGYNEKIRLIDSIGMRGRVRFDSFEKNAEKIYVIGDRFGFGSFMLDLLRQELIAKRRSISVSYDPICPDRINGIFDTNSRYAFLLSDGRAEDREKNKSIRHINMKRFMNSEKFGQVKADIKYAQGLYQKSLVGAMSHFENIKKIHFELEKIYGVTMDFSGVDKMTEDLIRKI